MDEIGIDRGTMARLARALSFIRSPEDPVVAALRQAAESGAERDVKRARSLFLKLKPPDRRAALAAIANRGTALPPLRQDAYAGDSEAKDDLQ